jgi:hypothetical protein
MIVDENVIRTADKRAMRCHPCGVDCDDDATPLPGWPYRHIRTIIERTYQLTVRMTERLIRGQMKTYLDLSTIQEGVPITF